MAASAATKRLGPLPAAAFLLALPVAWDAASAGEAFDTDAIEASVVRVLVPQANPDQTSIGTGWIVHGRRIVVTNNHVVEGGVGYHLAMMAGGKPKIVEARLLRRSPEKDLAVLEAVGDLPGTALPLAGYDAKATTRVIAIGFPGTADLAFFADRATGETRAVRFTLDDEDFYRPTWTEGVASRNLSYFRTLDGPALQHSAAINKGNSGGPLIDSCGRVLGVNTIRAVDGDPQGVFYAIHPKEVARFLEIASFKPTIVSSACTVTGPTAAYAFPMFLASLLVAAVSLWIAYRRQVPAVVKPLSAVADRVSRVVGGAAAFGPAGRALHARDRREAAAPRSPPRARAVTFMPRAAGPEFVIDREKLDSGQALVVGRSRTSDVVLSHESVSRRHARLWLDKAGVLWIEDLGSSGGTFVGTERITKAQVPPGTHVRFGAVGYTLDLGRHA